MLIKERRNIISNITPIEWHLIALYVLVAGLSLVVWKHRDILNDQSRTILMYQESMEGQSETNIMQDRLLNELLQTQKTQVEFNNELMNELLPRTAK